MEHGKTCRHLHLQPLDVRVVVVALMVVVQHVNPRVKANAKVIVVRHVRIPAGGGALNHVVRTVETSVRSHVEIAVANV